MNANSSASTPYLSSTFEIEPWTTLKRVETSAFEPLLDPKEAAELVHLHPKTVIRMARENKIPAVRLGKQWRFRKSWLEAWIGNQLRSWGQPN